MPKSQPENATLAVEPEPQAWSPTDSEALYHVRSWGESYFRINEAGNLTARPLHDKPDEIDLKQVVDALRDQGVTFPCLIRLQDLLATRLVQLYGAFQTAIKDAGFEGGYVGVYPVKVNQLREVVEELLEAGRPLGFGLECGSKAEMVATLPYLEGDETLLICNGYKDAQMMRMMLSFQGLGKNVIPVMEKYAEFETIVRLAREMRRKPRFGVRVRLSTSGAGKWADSSGANSKFGVPLPELLRIVERLEEEGMPEALRLLHFHLGSQITDVQALKTGVREITRVYAHLRKRGLPVQYLDVGGGLGVNYDAAPYAAGSSGGGKPGIDYSVQEYANAIVFAVQEVCESEGVEPPIIVTENGRALTAHHSVLVVEVLAASEKGGRTLQIEKREDEHEVSEALTTQLATLTSSETLRLGELLEYYHDAVEQREKADTLFGYGYLGLEDKARAEELFWAVCRAINARVHRSDPEWLPEELARLDDLLVDQYLCDFSVFQSMMDYWSIGQRFPIVPISRHEVFPDRRAILVDLTCDSDGKVDRFVSPDGDKQFLEVHALEKDEPYYLAVCLMGAYQDILGDTHNLFGSVTEAHVYADDEEPDGFFIENVIPGTTIEQMLARVQYFPYDLERRVHTLLREKSRDGVLRPKAATELLERYRALFRASTYYLPE
ncbi:biosynthetic arginine decarboxylase [soil metagenome]